MRELSCNSHYPGRRRERVKVKRYYYKVLEAEPILSADIIIRLDTEFIENESEDTAKNDCEVNAAKRLLERLAETYPRLPIYLQGDALYAAESIIKYVMGSVLEIYPDPRGDPSENTGRLLQINTGRSDFSDSSKSF